MQDDVKKMLNEEFSGLENINKKAGAPAATKVQAITPRITAKAPTDNLSRLAPLIREKMGKNPSLTTSRAFIESYNELKINDPAFFKASLQGFESADKTVRQIKNKCNKIHGLR